MVAILSGAECVKHYNRFNAFEEYKKFRAVYNNSYFLKDGWSQYIFIWPWAGHICGGAVFWEILGCLVISLGNKQHTFCSVRTYSRTDSRLWQVGAVLTGDAPTASEWSTMLLSTKVHLILEIWQYAQSKNMFYFCLDFLNMCTSAVGSYHGTVKYKPILYTAMMSEQKSDFELWQNTHHTLPSQANYGVYIVKKILPKIDQYHVETWLSKPV